jgi:hypothetical protein
MAVILAYGSPALGHLYPPGALLRELGGRGHQIHLRSRWRRAHAAWPPASPRPAVSPAVRT